MVPPSYLNAAKLVAAIVTVLVAAISACGVNSAELSANTTEVQHLSVLNLLTDSLAYDQQEVAVAGVLGWGGDKKRLYVYLTASDAEQTNKVFAVYIDIDEFNPLPSKLGNLFGQYIVVTGRVEHGLRYYATNDGVHSQRNLPYIAAISNIHAYPSQ